MVNLSQESQFIVQSTLLSSVMTKRVDGQLSYHGISFTEYLILKHLYQSSLKTMRRIELADSIGITASGITRLVAPMEKIGLVEKESNPRDARQSLVKLSKAGERMYKEASVSVDECAQKLLSGLSASQLEKLMELLCKIN